MQPEQGHHWSAFPLPHPARLAFYKHTKPTQPLRDYVGPKADSILPDAVALSQTPGYGTAFPWANLYWPHNSSDSEPCPMSLGPYPMIRQSIFQTPSEIHLHFACHRSKLSTHCVLATFPSTRRLDKFHSMSQCTRQSTRGAYEAAYARKQYNLRNLKLWLVGSARQQPRRFLHIRRYIP